MSPLAPEITIFTAAVFICMGGTFAAGQRIWRWIAGAALLAAAVMLWRQPTPGGIASLQFDALAQFGRRLALGLGALLLLTASRPRPTATAEYVGLTLLAIAGTMLSCVAGDLVLLFVALELISIPTYALLYLGRRDQACQESAAKYFFLSVLASAILLYGFSFLYGAAGTTDLAAVRAALESKNSLPPGFSTFAKLAVALIFAGLCFKIAAVPFHFYAPDVYQGTTHPNAALLSALPKLAGFWAMTRILVITMPKATPHAWQLVLVAAVLTMTLGNTLAFWQTDLRRLLAYSSIAQAGYVLLALAAAMVSSPGDSAAAWNGIDALGFYVAVYALATIGAFAMLEHLGRADRSLDGVDELAGLGVTRPLAAAVVAVCMFSLAGMPPLAGFWGKLMIFGSALSIDAPDARWWFVGAAVLGVLNAAAAAAYYLRVVAVMYFRTPLATPRAEGGRGALAAAVLCAALVVAGWIGQGFRVQGSGARPGARGDRPEISVQKREAAALAPRVVLIPNP
jgi:NADH-quinone oxidoreductase subunit N